MTYKTYMTYLAVFIAGSLAGGYLLPQIRHAAPPEPPPLEIFEQTLPEVTLNVEPEVLEASPGARLRVLNGKVVPIYENKTDRTDRTDQTQEATAAAVVRLTGIRVLGEMQNIGTEPVLGAKPILRFFDEDDNLILTKVGVLNDEFDPLSPGEVGVYDVIVPDPPKSETISIEMRAADIDPGVARHAPADVLKIKDINLEPAELERKDPKSKEKIKIKYYKFSGTLVNTADFDLANPGLYLWIKNDKNEVIGLTKKVFTTDVLAAGKEREVNILIMPLTEEEVFSHEVKTFAERL